MELDFQIDTSWCMGCSKQILPKRSFVPIPSYARGIISRLLPCLRPLSHSHKTSPFRGTRHYWFSMPSCTVDALDQSLSLPREIDLSPMNSPNAPPEYLVDAVRNLGQLLPIECELFGQGDLKIVGSYPISAGGFADVWVGERDDGTMVAIKSYRYYSSLSCLPVYLRLYKEVLTCSRLNENARSFVSFIGIYSTPEHPFSLVFELMNRQNLRDYLKNNQDIARLELLLEIARGLSYMHDLGIVHGNVKITNILVDDEGHVHIAGLGAALVLSTTAAVDIDQSFHGAAPELIDPRRWGFANAEATMASDVYAFSVLAWEVFAGRSPFSEVGVVAGVHSMLKGRRPARPDHPELSNRVWKMIRGCWKADPARRKKITEVVAILEVEVSAHKSR